MFQKVFQISERRLPVCNRNLFFQHQLRFYFDQKYKNFDPKIDYYKRLNLSKTAKEGEIKKSYYQQALKYHPDKNKDKDTSERFREIQSAYEVLKDSEIRKQYDQARQY